MGRMQDIVVKAAKKFGTFWGDFLEKQYGYALFSTNSLASANHLPEKERIIIQVAVDTLY